jgi:hypothetical protein
MLMWDVRTAQAFFSFSSFQWTNGILIMTKSKVETNVIATCERLLKSYNPVTHSIDTHCLEQLGDVTRPEANPQNVLIQQIVYGCHKEKPLLKVLTLKLM